MDAVPINRKSPSPIEYDSTSMTESESESDSDSNSEISTESVSEDSDSDSTESMTDADADADADAEAEAETEPPTSLDPITIDSFIPESIREGEITCNQALCLAGLNPLNYQVMVVFMDGHVQTFEGEDRIEHA
jgi:hypothetical protein